MGDLYRFEIDETVRAKKITADLIDKNKCFEVRSVKARYTNKDMDYIEIEIED